MSHDNANHRVLTINQGATPWYLSVRYLVAYTFIFINKS